MLVDVNGCRTTPVNFHIGIRTMVKRLIVQPYCRMRSIYTPSQRILITWDGGPNYLGGWPSWSATSIHDLYIYVYLISMIDGWSKLSLGQEHQACPIQVLRFQKPASNVAGALSRQFSWQILRPCFKGCRLRPWTFGQKMSRVRWWIGYELYMNYDRKSRINGGVHGLLYSPGHVGFTTALITGGFFLCLQPIQEVSFISGFISLSWD